MGDNSSSLKLVGALGSMSATNSQVFIVARHDFSVDGIVSILEAQKDTYLISCMEPSESCRQKFRATRPDVLMLHKSVPPEPVEEFIAGILNDHPDVRILVFGQGMRDDYLYRIVRAGVHGYINEKMTGAHLTKALETVKRGEYWIERHILQRFVFTHDEWHQHIRDSFGERTRALCENLTRREAEILEKILEGLPTKDIAEAVHLSHQGVKAHLSNLFKKFGVKNRPQLILSTVNQASPFGDLTGLLQQGLREESAPAQSE